MKRFKVAPRQSGGNFAGNSVHFDAGARVPPQAADHAVRGVEMLANRARKIGRLKGISDALLISLLSNSDALPDRVQQGVVLFNQGEHSSFWYLLLSGEVQLFLPQKGTLSILSAGGLFGQLDLPFHCCSALITRPAEFIRISQQHFTSVYCKHADHLQSYITVMEDIITESPYQQQESFTTQMSNGTEPSTSRCNVQHAPPPAPGIVSYIKSNTATRKLPIPQSDYSDYGKSLEDSMILKELFYY
ncbi:hypothetical protein WR25_01624 [Diploscapter pachys]|uniref:Cyclic nucleotide-binding domain-containing protein n=1 Tax=Diploscapter pachys TaxID=2018661 RepID=A0A2A2L5G0_9BILA|nr:hypothetical protein WR25_01624 [Diploscapter pachys]